MRKKAELKIRQAAQKLDPCDRYRIDQVRACAGLIPKVYDKTLLDMDRLGTVELLEGDTGQLTEWEVGDLLRKEGRVYMYFRFLESGTNEGDVHPRTIDVIIQGVDHETWKRFETCCREREQRGAADKIQEMIREYVQADK